MSVPKQLWAPPEDLVANCTMTRFARWARDGGFEDYEELWAWSVEDLERFWRCVWEYFDVAADAAPERVLGSREMPGAEWFPGVQLNYAEHVFRGREDDDVALQFASETVALDSWTWRRLRDETARVRAGLVARGVAVGDRVVAYLGNVPETVAAFLATASLGAVWSSCSPDFGAQSVIDRFQQIEPKVLLATDTYDYGGKTYDKTPVVDRLREELGAEHVVLLGEWFPETDAELDFERVPFDHPLWVLYSSGTTGLPEGDRPGPGRHPARAPQEDAPAPERAGGRPGVLVHHHRVDDVELPRRRAAHARVDRPSTTATRGTRRWIACGTSPKRAA